MPNHQQKTVQYRYEKNTIYSISAIITVSIVLSGCTQVVTAPIKVAGATAGAAIDVAGSAVGAVAKTVSGGK